MSNFNDNDLFIMYRPEDDTHYKVEFQYLMEAIIEIIDGGGAVGIDEEGSEPTTTD